MTQHLCCEVCGGNRGLQRRVEHQGNPLICQPCVNIQNKRDTMNDSLVSVAMNNFALRHTPDSPYSHYGSNFDALCYLVIQNFGQLVVFPNPENLPGEAGKVTVPGDAGAGFMSAVVQAKPGMEFRGIFDSRTPEEHPYFSIRAAAGDKVPAAEVDIIVYSHDRLKIKNENTTDADWEIVSINAKRTKGEEPPHPVAMIRNQKNYPGGTPTSYSPEQWANAVEYWLGGGPEAPFVMLDTGH